MLKDRHIASRRPLYHLPYRRILLLCFLVAYLVPMLLIVLPTVSYMRNRIYATESSDFQYHFDSVVSKLVDDLNRICLYDMQIRSDAVFKGLTFMQNADQLYTRYTATEYQSLGKRIRMTLSSSDFCDDAIHIFPRLSFALTKEGGFELPYAFDQMFRLEDTSYKVWLDTVASRPSGTYLFPYGMRVSNGQTEYGMTVMVGSEITYTGAKNLVSLYWIHENRLLEHLRSLPLAYSFSFSITQGNSLLYRCGESSNDSITFSSTAAVAYMGMPFSFTCSISPADLHGESAMLFQNFAILLFIIAICGCIVIWIISVFCYKPIRQIFEASMGQKCSSVDPTLLDFVQLSSYLLHVGEETEVLRQNLDSNQELIKYALLAKTYKGKLHPAEEDLLKMFSSVGITLPFPYITVGIFYEPCNADDMILSTNACHHYLIELDGKNVILFNHVDPHLSASLFMQALPLALSDTHTSCIQIAAAYMQALSAVGQRPACSHAPILYSASLETEHHEGVFLVDSDQTIMMLLQDSRWDKALREFEAIVHRSLKQQLTETEMLRLLKNIDLLLQRYGASKFVLPDTVSSEEAIGIIRAELERKIQQMADPTADASADLAAQALRYITDHLCNPDLSLLNVAEALHVSDSLLSKTIKVKLHMGYLDLVNSRRIDLAKQIMVQESVSIKEVAERVGYSNDITFRRLFKKFGGMLPSQYIAREVSITVNETDLDHSMYPKEET